MRQDSNDNKNFSSRDIDECIEKLKFENVHGPERGRLIGEVRGLLEAKFKNTDGLSPDLFKNESIE